MTRVATAGGRAYLQAMAGLGILFVVVLGSAAWLGRLLLGWSRRLRRLETALASSTDELPKLDATGQRDLDRIVDAVNRAGARLADAHREAEALMRQVAEEQRLATLGRVVAGVAHEIRNLIAAMRLKAERRCRRSDPARRTKRCDVEQIGSGSVEPRNLLGSVQRAAPAPKLVEDVTAFLEERAELFREQAAAHGLALEVRGCDGEAVFDPARIAQAIDNLTLNAIQNTPNGGSVTLCAERTSDRLALSVVDTGRGVPESMRDHLFEPFVTGRPEGTGLVLRSCGRSRNPRRTACAVHHNDGTTFVLELPWRPS
jgi:signal transduction histidine kinase